MALSQTSGFIGTKQSTKNNTLDSVDWEHRTKQDGQVVQDFVIIALPDTLKLPPPLHKVTGPSMLP